MISWEAFGVISAVFFVDHCIGYSILTKAMSLCDEKRIEIIAIVTTEDNGKKWWPGVEPLAKSLGIPFYRYNEMVAVDMLGILDTVDYFFFISWKFLMPQDFLTIPRFGAINLHYSLLPKYRGSYPVNWVIINGETETGITYHWVSNAIDRGNIILQRKVRIENIDTARSLCRKMDTIACNAFNDLISCLDEDPLNKGIPQNDSDRQSLYTKKMFWESNEIDLNKEIRIEDFLRFIRGKTFYPEGKNMFFIDPLTKEKIYLSVILEKEVDE